MANKTTIGNPQTNEAYIRSRQNLEQAGFSMESIEKILNSRSIAAILSDYPQVANFLQKQYSRYSDLVNPKYGFKATYAEPPALENYQSFYGPDRDVSKGTPFIDYIEGKYFANPELFVSMGIMTPQQVECLRKLMTQGSLSDVEAMTGQTSASKVESEEATGTAGGGGYATKGYGGSGGSQPIEDGPTGGGGAPGYGMKGFGGDAGYGMKGFGGADPGTAPGYPGGGGGGFGGGMGGYGGNDYGSPMPGMSSNLSAQQQQEILGMVSNTPVYGLFGLMNDREARAKDIYAGIFDRMNQRTNLKNQILMDIQNTDMTTPEGQKKFFMLQQQLSEQTQGEKEDYDFIIRVQQANNEFMEMVKKIIDDFYKTQEKIVSDFK